MNSLKSGANCQEIWEIFKRQIGIFNYIENTLLYIIVWSIHFVSPSDMKIPKDSQERLF